MAFVAKGVFQMQKAQVFLRDDQKEKLKAIAARTGKKQSALIREGVDRIIEANPEPELDWREATRRAFGIWADRDDVEEIIAENRRHWDERVRKLHE